MFSPLDAFHPLTFLALPSSLLTLGLSLALLGLCLHLLPQRVALGVYSFSLSLIPSRPVWYPFLAALFLLIAVSNTIGLIPYTFSWTALFSMTLTLSFSVWLGILLSSVAAQGKAFLSHFLPEGVPFALSFLLIPIEVISYLARALSLGVRLSANIISGHLLLSVLLGFVGPLGSMGPVLLLLVATLSLLEIAVSLIQAYVFATLVGIYMAEV